MSKRMGLPVTLKMRHDAHYVESLTSYSGAAVGRMIPVDQIRPNPDQPRKALGDLRELTDSIREKGVLEPLLVRFVPREECYYIISGERRYHAARAAGLREVARLKHLQHLNLDCQDMDDDGLKELKALRQLRVLHLRGYRITDTGVRHLATLDRLQRLHLWGTSITDEGVGELGVGLAGHAFDPVDLADPGRFLDLAYGRAPEPLALLFRQVLGHQVQLLVGIARLPRHLLQSQSVLAHAQMGLARRVLRLELDALDVDAGEGQPRRRQVSETARPLGRAVST